MGINLSKKPAIIFYSFIVLLTFMDTAVYLSMRSIWFFINKTIGGSLPWASFFFVLFFAVFLYSLVLLIRCIRNQRRGADKPRMVSIIVPVFFVVIFSAIDVYLYIMLGSSQNIVPRNLAAMLPYILLLIAAIFLIAVYPNLRISHNRWFKYAAAGVLVLLILLYLVDFGKVRITAGPCIQITGDSKLSVVWTTNKNSTAFVEYGTDESNLKRVYPSNNGIIDANTRVHRVEIPIDSKSEFIYRTGSTKINNYYQNYVEYGNTVLSEFRKFSDYRLKDRISFYVLSDVHENASLYERFLSGDDYDFVVLNGDLLSSLDSRSIIVNQLLKPLYSSTKGNKPFYFARGNHETRGAYGRDLSDYIALPGGRYYYTFSFGPVYAIVLDSGEDKLDSHEEYGGLADFENYRKEETEWLQALAESGEYKNAKYRIAFVHIPLNSYEDSNDPDSLRAYQQKWRELLNTMDVDAVFSGHLHTPQMIKPDNKVFNYPTFIGGGEYNDEENYAALKVDVTGESLKVQFVNGSGSVTNEYEINK